MPKRRWFLFERASYMDITAMGTPAAGGDHFAHTSCGRQLCDSQINTRHLARTHETEARH